MQKIEHTPEDTLKPTDESSYHIKVLCNRGLNDLIKLCQDQGIPDYVSWDKVSNNYKILIPFSEFDKSIAEAQILNASNYQLEAEINNVINGKGQIISVLEISANIAPESGYYSAYDLSVALGQHNPFMHVVQEAFDAIHGIKPPKAPEIDLLKGVDCLELPEIDFSDITDSSTAVLYKTALRAALAIPLNLVPEERHAELKDLLDGMALQHAGRTGSMEANDSICAIIQIEKSAYENLKDFAATLGLSFKK